MRGTCEVTKDPARSFGTAKGRVSSARMASLARTTSERPGWSCPGAHIAGRTARSVGVQSVPPRRRDGDVPCTPSQSHLGQIPHA